MRVAQRIVSPGVLAVGLESGKRGAFGDGRSRRHVGPTHVSTEGVAGGEHTERLAAVWIDSGRFLEQRLGEQAIFPRHPPVMRQRPH